MTDTLIQSETTPMTTESNVEPALLSVRNLTVRYATKQGPPVVAVKSVDLTIRRGERIAVVGESGSGKTTMGLAIGGFLTSATAEVTSTVLEFEGRPMQRSNHSRMPERTPGLSMVFQDAMTSLDPVWTIGSQLRSVLKSSGGLSRGKANEAARSWLTRVGLTDTDRALGARPYELSGGMRQRAMLALALASNPRLLIADEPTSALDASLSREMMELMVGLADDFGASLLIISHDIQLCQEYSDRMLVMLGGEVVEQGESATIATTASHPYAVALMRCVPTLDSASLDRLPTLQSVQADIDRMTAAAAVAC
jgi:peptide/nickel transport system ATP-binding protein